MTTDEQVSALRRTAAMMRDGSETITLRQQIAELRDLLEWLKEHDSVRVPAMRAALLTLMETEARLQVPSYSDAKHGGEL